MLSPFLNNEQYIINLLLSIVPSLNNFLYELITYLNKGYDNLVLSLINSISILSLS